MKTYIVDSIERMYNELMISITCLMGQMMDNGQNNNDIIDIIEKKIKEINETIEVLTETLGKIVVSPVRDWVKDVIDSLVQFKKNIEIELCYLIEEKKRLEEEFLKELEVSRADNFLRNREANLLDLQHKERIAEELWKRDIQAKEAIEAEPILLREHQEKKAKRSRRRKKKFLKKRRKNLKNNRQKEININRRYRKLDAHVAADIEEYLQYQSDQLMEDDYGYDDDDDDDIDDHHLSFVYGKYYGTTSIEEE